MAENSMLPYPLGAYAGDGVSCSPDLCASITGACCSAEGCRVAPMQACASGGGVYQGDGTACATTLCRRQ